MKLPDLDGIDARAEAGAILDAAEIKLLTAIIRQQADHIETWKATVRSLAREVNHHNPLLA